MQNRVEITIHGATGSGKSTIALVVSQALRDQGFSVAIDGIDVGQQAPDEFVRGLAASFKEKSDAIAIHEVRPSCGITTTREKIAAQISTRAIEVEDCQELLPSGAQPA